jgi:hypothetical protein
MEDDSKLEALVKRLHQDLSGKFGITGFGTSDGQVNVYRSSDHPDAEGAIRRIVEEQAPGTPVRLTPPGGRFRAF